VHFDAHVGPDAETETLRCRIHEGFERDRGRQAGRLQGKERGTRGAPSGPEESGKEAIAEKTEAQLKRAEITAQEVVNQIAYIARSRLDWFFDERGNLLPPEKLSPDAAAALEGWDVVRRYVASGDGHTDEVIRIRRWNKVELKLLAQRFGLLDERAQLGGKFEIRWKGPDVEMIRRGLKRAKDFSD
jgi:hypothetical protein